MKKILSLLLALIFIMSCCLTLSSCDIFNSGNDNENNSDINDSGNNDSGNNDSNNNTNDSNNDTAQTTYAKIISEGVPQYVIVYPDNCATNAYVAVIQLVEEIMAHTGVRFEYITASEAMAQDEDRYILIGATSFQESIAAIEELDKNSDAFSIKRADEKIVIAAHYGEGIVTAINYFLNNQLEENYDESTKTLWLDEYYSKGKTPLATSFRVPDIAKYTIIYNDTIEGMYEVAAFMRDSIKTATGQTLKIKKDTNTAESEHEILIGKTNRGLSSTCYANGARLMEYEVVVEKGRLQIVCGGPYSANLCITSLIDTYFNKITSIIPEGKYLTCNLATEKVAHKAGTDVRCHDTNILAQSADSLSAGFLTSVVRAEIFAKILVDYTPDFVGVQEADASYATAMSYYFQVIKELYGLEYSSTNTTLNGIPVANYIIYRSDKYKLDDQKAALPSYANPKSSLYHSVLSSAKFTSIEDPTVEIAILSAHWHWEKEDAVVGTPKQQIDAEQMAAEYKTIQKKYPNAQIFCTGDFNSHRFDNLYLNQLLTDINGEIASNIARKNGVLHDSFKHNISGKPKEFIDHIIGKSGTFDVLIHAGTYNHSDKLTDHQPVYADIKFIK